MAQQDNAQEHHHKEHNIVLRDNQRLRDGGRGDAHTFAEVAAAQIVVRVAE